MWISNGTTPTKLADISATVGYSASIAFNGKLFFDAPNPTQSY